MIQEYKTDDETSAVPVKIEALAKQFMTHYCTLDFDHAFTKNVLQRTDSNNEQASMNLRLKKNEIEEK